MITSISKVQNAKTNNITHSKKQSNIAFQGNFPNVGKNIIEAESPNVNSVFGKFAVKVLELPLFQKLGKVSELQVSKKPLIAATSMDPMDHISAEQRAQLASQSKGKLEKLSDLIFGSKKPKVDTEDIINNNAGNKTSNEISSRADNLEKTIDNTIINPNASKLADSVLDSTAESIHHVRPEDLVFGPDGSIVYEINPKIEAELNVAKLEHLAQDASKGLPEHIVDPKDIIWDQNGNIVDVIDHTEPIISSHHVVDHNTGSDDIDIDLSEQFMGT